MKEIQVFNNAKWIIVCKVAQSIIQLIIGMLTARYLGPSNYGLISYAASILAFAIPIMRLGFDATMVSELVDSPEKEGEIVGTSLFSNLITGAVGIIGVIAFVSVFDFGEPQTIFVCSLYSTSLIFAALEMIQYWFQYKLFSKYSSVVMLCAYIVISIYKAVLLITRRKVYWFAVSHTLEYALIAISLLVIYFKLGGQKFKFSKARAKTMLARSKYYIISALMVVVIQNTDHIMLTSMIDEKANGVYTAAITSVTVFQFVFTAIIDSFRPYILAKKKESMEVYECNIKRLYSLTLYLAILQAIVFTVFAKLIIMVLYGEDYMSAVPILRILTPYFIFSLMGSLRNVWILAEYKQKYLWCINLFGALANIIMNAFMIPLFGIFGAAFASLLTQFFANFILSFIIPDLRKNNYLIIKAMDPSFFLNEFKNIIKIIEKREA